MTTEMKIIHDQISPLTKSITTLEQELKQDLRFLKSYKSIQMSCWAQLQCTPQNPKIISGVLIHVAKKVLGNLKFRLWEKMLVIVNHTPVILDPNISPSFLTLSDDLTSV
ncbi:tripartite motif-containing protein 35-like [Salmo trutta]|uniref:tripartite motif-containing protein 35-like n=1 Tax=Salmo trutta TaxID=8032 RepID=UPI00112FDBA1|nr:tripartite motif-containing protein 35-like [Salmo trutta]